MRASRPSSVLVVALSVFAACGGDSGGDPGELAAVFPANGFIGRKLRVEVSGDTTSWDATTTLNFICMMRL